MLWPLLLLAGPASALQGQAATEETRLSGEVTLGLRFVDVDGAQAQFDEDRNLDHGPFLRAFVIEGALSRGSGPIDRFLVRASGVGDPNTRLRLETVGGPWKTVARFDRSRFVGNAEADLHSFDVRRDTGSVSVEYAPDEGEAAPRSRSAISGATGSRSAAVRWGSPSCPAFPCAGGSRTSRPPGAGRPISAPPGSSSPSAWTRRARGIGTTTRSPPRSSPTTR